MVDVCLSFCDKNIYISYLFLYMCHSLKKSIVPSIACMMISLHKEIDDAVQFTMRSTGECRPRRVRNSSIMCTYRLSICKEILILTLL